MKNTPFIFLRISLLLLFVFAALLKGAAQEYIPSVPASVVEKYMNGKTYVVLEDELLSDYNFCIESVMESHWYQTVYEVISATDFESMRTDASSSFLYLNPVYFEKDKTATEYVYLFLSMGHPSGDIEQMPDLCAVPLAVRETEQEKYLYKLGLFLQFIQQHVKLVEQMPEADGVNLLDFYASRDISLSDYKLILLKDEVEPGINNSAGFGSVYPYPFEFVPLEEVQTAIEEKRERTLILHLIKAGENRFCVKFIADAGTGDLIFYDYHKIGGRMGSVLLEKDIKKLTK